MAAIARPGTGHRSLSGNRFKGVIHVFEKCVYIKLLERGAV
jgi:hypothetical protein